MSAGSAATEAQALVAFYPRLLAHFGPQHWWPGESPWEVALGALLTQRTTWQSVTLALDHLRHQAALAPAALLALPMPLLEDCLRPTGTFRQKAARARLLAQWWLTHAEAAATWPRDRLRAVLLALPGIGPETADSIALYAFGQPIFVVDAYTRRVLARHGLVPSTATYAEMQTLFHQALPPEMALYNEYHALLVALAKRYCRPKPACAGCPLRGHLAEVGGQPRPFPPTAPPRPRRPARRPVE